MHRYRVEFASKSIDESRLRDFLEQRFGLSEIAVVRGGQSTSGGAGPKNITEEKILALLADGKPWRRKAIIKQGGFVQSPQLIDLLLRRMTDVGIIRKLQHGVYSASNEPVATNHEIPALKRNQERQSHQRILTLLTEPKSARAIQQEIGVTRQRIDQLLKAMLKANNIKRVEVAGERGRFRYIRCDSYDSDAFLTRQPDLHESRVRILSALAPETLSRVTEVALIGSANIQTLPTYLVQLSAMGLTSTFKLGQHWYVGITPRGLQHPQYDPHSPKAKTADLLADFGEERVSFIQFLQALGAARTADLTFLMPKDYFRAKKHQSGNIIQRLEMAGLTEKVLADNKGHPLHRLTGNGYFVAGILSRVRPCPSADVLRATISERRKEYNEFLRRAGGRPQITNGADTTTQD
jgi:hypothetical protein